MRVRVSTAACALTLLFASALYAPPVEAAGLSSIPPAIGGFLAATANFVSGLVTALHGPVHAQPAALAAGQGITASPPITLASGNSKSAATPTGSIAVPALTVSATGTFATKAGLRAALDHLALALTKALAASRPAASVATVGRGYSDTAPTRTNDLSFENLTVNGVTGLTATDIPDLSREYLSTTGGTITGNLTVTGAFSGGALSLANASTTQISAMSAYFGGTATSTFGTDGSLTLAKALGVASGGTGWGSIAAGAILFGNGSSALATSSSLFWNNAGGRLGIGTGSPSYPLDVSGIARATFLDLGGGIFNAQAYGAKGDGTTDDTSAIQAALNAAASAGGGTVYLPPTGHAYVISTTLTLTDGVKLSGAATKSFQGSEGTEAQWTAHGTWLKITSTTVPAVSLIGHGSAIDGINFIGANGATWNPIPTEPWTITVSADAFSISNVLILNRANGIDVQYSYGHGGGTYSYIHDVWFSTYQVGLTLDKINDNLDLNNLHFRNIVGMDNSSTADYLLQNFVAMKMGDYDNPEISGIDIFSAHIGMYFYNDQALSSDPPHSLVGAQVSNVLFNLVDQAMVVGSATTTVNGDFTNVAAGGVGSISDLDLNDTLFWLRSDNVNLQFNNFTIGFTGGAVMELGNGSVSGAKAIIDGAQISNWSNTATSTNAFIVYPNAQLTLSASNFSSSGHSAYTTVGSGSVLLNPTIKDDGNQNTFTGVSALLSLTSGIQNTAVGYHASKLLTGSGATAAFGAFAMESHTGNQNTAIGAFALEGAGSGPNNTAVGFQAGNSDTSGSGNLFLGWNVASTTATGSNNIALGYDIALPSINGSNQLDIGNLLFGTGINGEGSTLSTGNIGIGVAVPTYTLDVAGRGHFTSLVDADHFVATSTTATSTFGAAITVNAGQGNSTFGGAISINGSTGTTTLAAGQGFTIGGSQFVVQQGSGSVGVGTVSPGSKLTIADSDTDTSIGGGAIAEIRSASANHAALRFLLNNTVEYSVGIDSSNNLRIVNTNSQKSVSNSTAGLILNSTGNVGIDTSTPYSRLEVWGPDIASTTAFSVVNSASTTAFAVYDNGNATYSGSIFNSSDQRLKTDVASLDASSSLAAIEQLNPISYTRIDQPGQGGNLGFLAQDVQQVFPELVSVTTPSALTPDGTLTLNYTGLIAPIVGAIKALAGEITTLEETVAGFADSFTTHQLCIADTTGAKTCITKAQLDALLAGQGIAGQADQGTAASASTTPAISTPDASSTPTTASSTPDATATTTPDTPEQGSTAAPSDPSADTAP